MEKYFYGSRNQYITFMVTSKIILKVHGKVFYGSRNQYIYNFMVT